MRKFIKKYENIIILIIILFVVSACLSISFWIAQKEAFFHPYNDVEAYNYLKEQKNFEEVFIQSDGEILSGWINYNSEESKAPLLIIFLGNFQNSSNFCKTSQEIFKSCFEGYNILVLDYPEFGYSTGKLNEDVLLKNTLNIYEFAEKLEFVDEEKIVVMGYSIGTGMATYLASQKNVNGLILLAPYDNALNLYNDYLNIFYGILEKARRYNFTSDIYAQKVKTDPLIIASKKDEVIKYEHSLRLSKMFPNISKMVTVNNIGHGGFFSSEEVINEIRKYLSGRL